MEKLSHIQNEQLPLPVNFNALRQEGLAYVQEYSGSQWNNLNNSDPGITILDQVCYALTELGYCSDFPIKDLLTNAKGKLILKNQFYLPEEILTTSPITADDYRKYIIDQIDDIQNVIILPLPKSNLPIHTDFKVYLLPKVQVVNKEELQTICESVYYALNTVRNLGSFFVMPKILKQVTYGVYGQLKIKSGYQRKKVIAKIEYAINDYVFPKVVQAGYDRLIEEGYTTNQIFNGPILNNGWIPDTSLQPKKNKIRAFEITAIIASIEGVDAIIELHFRGENDPAPLYEITVQKDQVIVLQSIGNLGNDEEKAPEAATNQSQNEQNYSTVMATIAPEADQIAQVSALQRTPQLPSGKFRDVNSYYSIQHTFPEIYGVGHDAVNANASNLQIAQSRQLKGYLTLFDQVIANEFAQLSSLATLFSFKNSSTGYVSGETDTSKTVKTIKSEYPVPFESFSPTYFYQSLYDSVPNLEPLLKNNDTFRFAYHVEPREELDRNAWKNYKEDPYNAYIKGLLTIIEDDTVNLERRNSILDHLLARHGESPSILDAMIYGAPYSGNTLKDMVIIKSILLQNFKSLSYNRIKGYNFSAATKISSQFRRVTKEMQERFLQGYERDFIIDMEQLDNRQHITSQDYVDYSALELKLNLIFALEARYQNYLSVQKNTLAFWMITQRKGLILLETQLLLLTAVFEVTITDASKNETFWEVNTSLTYQELTLLEVEFLKNPQESLKNLAIENTQTQKSFSLIKEGKTNYPKEWFVPLGKTKYSWAVKVSWDDTEPVGLNNSLFQNKVVLLFPDFIPELNTIAFKNKIALFLESELPPALAWRCFFVNEPVLKALAVTFADWHNAMRFNAHESSDHTLALSKNAGKLVFNIMQLNMESND